MRQRASSGGRNGLTVALVCVVIGVGGGLFLSARLRAEWRSGWTFEAQETGSATRSPDSYRAIPPGEVEMGCSPGDDDCGDDEKPVHRVRITKNFEIGRHEVTQAQWEAVMGNNPSFLKGPDHPVEQVSWNDAQEFLAKLNARNEGYRYRLPTEAEWEYAARAGSTARTYGPLDSIAWYALNSGDETHPVGQKAPNAWGLYDMLGNVWEWCQDWYGSGYYAGFRQNPAVDPRGPARGEFRVLRGGSWYKYLWFMRLSSRFSDRPTARYRHVGFRCARERRNRQ